MPAALGFVQARVVAVLGVVDALLDADVARDAVALGKQLMRREESREAAVAVGYGVDCEQVEDECADQEEGMRVSLALGVLVAGKQLAE
jgi:hypothetical protein